MITPEVCVVFVLDINVNPVGIISLISTFVATFGPALLTVHVEVSVSPTFGVRLETDFTKLKSAR